MLQVHLFYHNIYWSQNKQLTHFKSHLKLFPFGLWTRVRCLEGCEGDLWNSTCSKMERRRRADEQDSLHRWCSQLCPFKALWWLVWSVPDKFHFSFQLSYCRLQSEWGSSHWFLEKLCIFNSMIWHFLSPHCLFCHHLEIRWLVTIIIFPISISSDCIWRCLVIPSTHFQVFLSI